MPGVDVDAYIAAHSEEWRRLDQLVSRRSKLTGDEVDELVTLYQRVGTHLSVVRSASPDPALIARLSSLVAAARSAVSGSHTPAWQEVARFFTLVYPAALYRSGRWWISVGVAFTLVSFIVGAWIAGNPSVQATIATPEEIEQLVKHDFADYYSSDPAGSFAAKVATNNAWVSVLVLVLGVMIVPAVYVLWQNALNVGTAGGLMVGHGEGAQFFGLILPHGMLELTCVFVAAGAGLRLGWSWIDPGPRTRPVALMQEGLAMFALALGLAPTLAVAGVIEAFVTPSGLPTWARVAIGVAAWGAFLSYIVVLGRRAVRAGETGTLRGAGETQLPPTAG